MSMYFYDAARSYFYVIFTSITNTGFSLECVSSADVDEAQPWHPLLPCAGAGAQILVGLVASGGFPA